ncbi:hypothetical protein ACFQZV_13175 [Microbacterium koreense]|uniref:YrhK domain-containing protein n=1 Tax=Microbacterium koreense TaxID=323761 RepID=A0ABW2ZUU8_9MICO
MEGVEHELEAQQEAIRRAGKRAARQSADALHLGAVAIENVGAVAQTAITGPTLTDEPPPPPPVRYVRRLRRSSWAFGLGALLFVVGAVMSLLGGFSAVHINITYVIGAVVFTAGAFIQLDLSGRHPPTHATNLADRADWWSAAVQLFGTLFFNVSTALALGVALGGVPGSENGWRPDALGSLAFLLSSALAAVATTQRTHLWDPLARTWRSMWLNALGSVAFAVSAALAFPASFLGSHAFHEPFASTASAIGTAIGGAAFFFSAILSRRTIRIGEYRVDVHDPGRAGEREAAAEAAAEATVGRGQSAEAGVREKGSGEVKP